VEGKTMGVVGEMLKRRPWVIVFVFLLGGAVGGLTMLLTAADKSIAPVTGGKQETEAAPAKEEKPTEEVAKDKEAEEEAEVGVGPDQLRLAGVKTFEVTPRSLTREIQAVGRIDYDEKRLAFVSARVAGRIDRLYVNFTGTTVERGQPLLELYSPDLVSAQQEYLLALTTLERISKSPQPEIVEGTRSLVEAARKRLLLWGITDEQIGELKNRREPRIHMTILSPITGTVIEKKALEGKYVAAGEPLYTIADLSSIWMLAEVYEYEMGLVRLDQEVEITTPTYSDRPFKGKISFINPSLEEKTRTVKVRADVPNPDGRLKPGMFVRARLVTPLGRVLAVPTSAILDAGVHKFTYVEKGHSRGHTIFERRAVRIGPEANGYYPVLAGLSPGEKVVTAANFLIDSQVQLEAGAAAGGHGGH